MVATTAASERRPATRAACDTMKVCCLIPALQYWSNVHIVAGNAIEIEHLWMTALRWKHLPGYLKDGWHAERVFGFVVAHKVS